MVPFAATGQLGAVAMDCDRVVFAGDAPQLPYGAPIVAYTQRFSGQQTLPAQVGDPSHLHNQLSWVKKVLCLISETIGGSPTYFGDDLSNCTQIKFLQSCPALFLLRKSIQT